VIFKTQTSLGNRRHENCKGSKFLKYDFAAPEAINHEVPHYTYNSLLIPAVLPLIITLINSLIVGEKVNTDNASGHRKNSTYPPKLDFP
jgi:hypothetical protein